MRYLMKTTISTLDYPRCTKASATDLDSDCGSVGWAFTLFIAWNLLSMVCAFPNSLPLDYLREGTSTSS